MIGHVGAHLFSLKLRGLFSGGNTEPSVSVRKHSEADLFGLFAFSA